MNREHVQDDGIRRALEGRDRRHRALAKRAFALVVDLATGTRFDCDERFAIAMRAEDFDAAERLVAAAEVAHRAHV